jgi:hypothetical protein
VCYLRRSQWTRGLRRGFAGTRLLGLWVRILPGAWMFVSCQCCVLSGKGLCVGLISRPEECYRLWCVSECDREASIIRSPWPTGGCCAMGKKCVICLKVNRLIMDGNAEHVTHESVWLSYTKPFVSVRVFCKFLEPQVLF